jgi:preprotein translocase subunit YajC
MSFLISNAWADAAAQASTQPSLMAQMLPLVLLLAVFYFLLIRPQMKRSKEHRQMLSALAKGDEVVTSGGVIGKVREIGENLLVIEIADKIEVRVQKQAVTSVLPKGTMQSL